MNSMSSKLDKSVNSQSLRQRTFIVVSLFFAIILLMFGLYEWTKNTVAIEQNGEEVVVQTHENSVQALFKSLGIEVSEHDYINPPLDTVVSDEMNVVYKEANQVTLIMNGEEERFYTTTDTVLDLLDEKGLNYHVQDQLSPNGEESIEDGLTITYTPAVELSLTYDGKEQSFWSSSATVADFLKEANVSVGEEDRVEPGLDQELHKGLAIQLVRVEKVTDVIEESTAYETIRQDDKELNQGIERIVEQGERGVQELHYEVTYEDGEEVERELIKTEMVSEAKDRLVSVGTKAEEAKQYVAETQTANETIRSSSSVASQSEETKKEPEPKSDTIQMSATAYSAECNGCSGITATGINLLDDRNKKVVAVDPSIIPLGTRVHVEGYGEAIAGDTGGAIKGNKIDLHVPTRDAAMQYGRKNVTVTILD
ncbi:cell wall-binding protein [Bacillus sp. JCM 19046]|nr:cell wall-binding protein [Bacillus sp. JCM 19045]GAF17707.1 cell wall-binding protein [Bacillus sp. JCM 19046]